MRSKYARIRYTQFILTKIAAYSTPAHVIVSTVLIVAKRVDAARFKRIVTRPVGPVDHVRPGARTRYVWRVANGGMPFSVTRED